MYSSRRSRPVKVIESEVEIASETLGRRRRDERGDRLCPSRLQPAIGM